MEDSDNEDEDMEYEFLSTIKDLSSELFNIPRYKLILSVEVFSQTITIHPLIEVEAKINKQYNFMGPVQTYGFEIKKTVNFPFGSSSSFAYNDKYGNSGFKKTLYNNSIIS